MSGLSDDFASGTLGPLWLVEGPSGVSTSIGATGTDGFLELVTPDGNYDVWGSNNGARAMQAVTADGDFTVEVRFLTTPTERYQIQGILVEQDADNWIRLDTYSDGTNLYAFAAVTVNGQSSTALRVRIPEGTAEYLRVTRTGDDWSLEYSQDGVAWTAAGSFTHALSVSSAGVFAGNAANAAGFTAQVDYVEFASDPIADEDGTITPVPNEAPVAGDDAVPATTDTVNTIAVTDLLANDSDPNGDALTLTGITQPANGTLVDNGDGTLSYTPTAGYAGADSFTYTVSDGDLSDTATVALSVTAPPPAADLSSDDFSAGANPWSGLILSPASQGPSGSDLLSFDGTDRAVVVDLSTGTYANAARVMPIGDSLTVGVVDGTNPSEVLEGYRLDFFESVTSAGGWIDYVGSASSGPAGMLDTDHAALEGARARDAADVGLVGPADVSEATATHDPDIALMMFGTNDIGDATDFPVRSNGDDAVAPIMANFETLIDQFFANSAPGSHLVVSTLAPRIDRGREAVATEYFNEGYSLVDGQPVVGDAGNGTYIPGLIAKITELQQTYSSLLLFENPHAVFETAGSAESLDHLSSDALHWTQEAYAEYASALYSFLETEVGLSAGTFGGSAQNIASNITHLYGSSTGDRLVGDSNDNVINGGAGSDLLEGGAGADTFAFDSSALAPGSFDRILDFNAAEGDTIDVSAIVSHLGLSAAQAQLAFSLTQTSDGVEVMLTEGGSTYSIAELAGVSLSDLGMLDPVWIIEGPPGISVSTNGDSTDGFLELVTPDGNYDVWGSNNGARAMQAVTADGDFAMEVRFLTTPTERYQIQGILVEQDADDWIRFDTYSDGTNLYAFAATTVGGSSSVAINVVIPGGTAEYLRVTRTGDDWSLEYSQDGVAWTAAGSFTHALSVSSAGVFAGNTANAAGFTAQVDYVEIASDPIADEDGTITPVPNVVPTAGDDAFAVPSDTATDIATADLLANDSDLNGDALTFASFTQPANGTLVDNGDGTLSYTPTAGYAGADSFTYTVSDGDLSDTATVALSVTAPPPAADLSSDDFSTNSLNPIWTIEGPAGISGTVTGNPTDGFLELVTPDGNYDVWGSNNGARAMQAVTADGDFAMEVRFLTTPTERYQIQGILVEQDADDWIRFDTYSDGTNLYAFAATTVGGSSSVAINVVIPGGTAEYLRVTRTGDDWSLEYSQDGVAWTAAGSFTHALSVSSAGVFAGNTANAAGFTAQVDYVEFASDPIADEDGTITPVPNEAPVAGDDAVPATTDTVNTIAVTDLLANDSDPNGDALTLTGITQPANGTLVDNGDGTLSYTPTAGYAGADSFTYTVSDGDLSDTATVALSVTAPPPAADLSSDDFSTNSLNPIWTIEGPAGISGTVTGNPTDGFLELVTPDGNYDVWGSNNGARAMQAVTADGDFAMEVRFLTTPTERYQIQGILVEQDADDWIRFDTYSNGTNLYAFAATTVGGSSSVAINVVIPGGTAEYLRVTRTGDDWSLEYSQDGVAWTAAGSFTHALSVSSAGVFAGNTANAAGFTAQVDYVEIASDPIADEDGTITPVPNEAPVAGDDAVPATTDTVNTIAVTDLLANDSDPNGDALTLTGITQPANGTLVDNGDGTLSYTPTAGYAGADSFTYTVSDGDLSDTATVALSVTAPPPAADLSSDDFSTNSLNPIWTIEGPAGISGTVTGNPTDGFLELVTPDGNYDVWGSNNGARAMQAVTADGDFAMEVRFLTTPTERYQIQGILVEQDADDWIRFDTYSNGTNLYAFAATTVGGSSSVAINVVIPGGTAEYLRVTRTGDDWSLEYSQDGVAWTAAGSFTHALSVSSAGVFAGNTANAAGFTAQVDYVEIASDPIADEDGTITPVPNEAPVAGDDAVPATTDTVNTIAVTDLLANDSDPNGDALTLTGITQPANGTLVDNGDGTLSYTPTAGYAGADSFTYTVSDGDLSDTATVALSVTAPPPAADLSSDDFSTNSLNPIWTIEGPAGISGTVTGNPTDGFLELVTPDGNYDVWGSNNGARAMQAVTADGDFAMEVRFLTTPTERYQIQGILVEQDADDWIRFDTYSNGTNLYAFAATTVGGSSSVAINVVIPGGTAEYLRVTRTGDDWSLEYSQDGVAWTAAGSFTHALSVSSAGVFAGNTANAAGFTAQVDYVEIASDPIADEDGTITPVPNEAPVAGDDAVPATTDTVNTIAVTDLLANDSDPNGDALTLTGITQPANGTLVDNGDGTLSYTPTAGYAGADSFTYTVSDGDLSDTATVALSVTAPPPAADLSSDDFSTNSLNPIWTIEGPAGISGTVTGNPTDGFLELVTPDGNYDVWGSNNGARAMQAVTADGDFAMEVRFLTTPTERYQIQGILVEQDADDWIRFDTYSDGTNLYAFAATTVGGSSSVAINVVIPGGTAEYLRVTRTGDDWSLEYSQDGVAWTAAGSFTHALSVSSAGVFAGNTANAAGFTAQVDYVEFASDPIVDEDGTITPVPNEAPVAGDDAVPATTDTVNTIAVTDLLANDSDPNGDALTLTGITQPANGTLVDNGDGTLSYTPTAGYAGADSFTYTVSDGDLSDTATVALSVTAPPPAADLSSDDFSTNSLNPIWTIEGPAGISGTVTGNPTDGFLELVTPDGNYDVWGSNNGARAMQAVTADGDFAMEVRFLTTPTERYQIQGILVEQDADDWIRFDTYSNGTNLYAFAATTVGGSSSVAINVVIPGGTAEYLRVTRTGDDWSLEYSQDGVAWTAAGSFTHALSVSSAGVFAGNTANAAGFTAQVDYVEIASDPIADEDGTITPVPNEAPVAGDDAVPATTDTVNTIAVTDLLANDSDPNGDALTLTGITQPANGTLVDNGDGTLSYTPTAGYAGADSFTYTVSDGDLSDTATVALSVTAPPPAADLSSDDFSTNSLNPIWTIEGPAGISGTVTGNPTDGFLELVTPDGNYDVWGSNNGARAMQAVTADGDFAMEVRFLTTPTERYQIQGILVEQDADDWIRFDTYSDGTNLYAFAATTVGGSSSVAINVVIPGGTAEYLRVTRTGDDWSLEYSQDGVAWTAAGSFTHALSVSSAGVFAGNTANAAGFTAQVDYVEFASDPIVDEDGSYVELNYAPNAVDDFLSITYGSPLTFTIAELLANDTDQNLDPLIFASFTQPANGTLVDNGDGTLSYTPTAGYAGADSFTYTVSDGELSSDATVTMREVIDLWYGDTQTFGAPGEAQTWLNILGNVSSDVTSLSYSLNGDTPSGLSIGPDTRRLQESGDFNIDLAYADLDGSATDDVITIIADLADGSTVTRDVTIVYEDGSVWGPNYTIDWDAVTNIQDVVQVVDGEWSIQNGGVRLEQLGYDRVLAFGDQSWDNYELRTSITTHDLTNTDPNGRDGGGFAIGMLWTGHTDDPISGFQPLAGWEPGAAFFYTNNDGVGAGKLSLHPSENFFWTLDNRTMTLLEDVTYNIVVRVEQTGIYDRTYRIKIWEEGSSEPSSWTMEGTETLALDREPATGGIYLNAHYQDVTFNDLTVTEITGSDITKGTENADILVSVDSAAANPGEGEIDVFVGYGGADVFVFGDSSGDFYDDGDSATSGVGDYAFVYDFIVGEDIVQLSGTEADYVLASDAAGLSPGTSVWKAGTGGAQDELIGVINGVYALSLAGDEFTFAGDAIG